MTRTGGWQGTNWELAWHELGVGMTRTGSSQGTNWGFAWHELEGGRARTQSFNIWLISQMFCYSRKFEMTLFIDDPEQTAPPAYFFRKLFSHYFSTFFPFHKLQLCSYIGKFWYIYVTGIKIHKNAPLFIPTPAYYIWLNFQPLCLLRPPSLFGT